MKELLTKMKDLISQPIPISENLLDTASDNKIMNKFDCYRYGITMTFPIKAEKEVNLLADYLNVNPDVKILNTHDNKSEGNYDKIISTLAGCRYLTQLQIGYRDALFVGNQALAALAHHKSLTFLGLPALMDEKSNLAILEKNTRLKTLKLIGDDDESADPNKFDEKVRILSNYSSVENFHFRACVMNAKAINYFSSNRGLKYLNLEGSNVGDEVTVILSTHPTLTRLNLSLCGISNVGVAFLMKNHVLRDLNLAENDAIRNKGAGLLSTHPSLTKLNLRTCKITDKGAGFLMNNHVLRDLSLQFTYVSDEGACLLSKHPTLTSLNLANCNVSLTGAAYFLQNTVLRSLNLSQPWIPPGSNILGNSHADYFWNHPTLTRLSLKSCHIGDKGAIELASNTRLTWLNLMDNPIGFLGAIALALNESLKTLKVSIPDEKQLGWLFLLGNQNLESLTIKYPKNHHPGLDAYRFCSAVRHHQGLNRLTIRNASRQMEQDQKFRQVLLALLPIPNVLTAIVFDYTKRGYSYPYDYGLFCRSLTPKIKKRINKELPQIREHFSKLVK